MIFATAINGVQTPSAHGLQYYAIGLVLVAIAIWLISWAIKNFAGTFDNEVDRWRERRRRHNSHSSPNSHRKGKS